MNLLTPQGKQIITEIAFIKYKKPFIRLTKKQKNLVINIFLKEFVNKKGNVEKKLAKMLFK